MAAVNGLVSEKTKRATDLMDELRDLAPESMRSELPQIGVFGQQSAGKSSVLAALSSIEFPSGSSTTTRCVTQVVLRPGPEERCTVKLFAVGDTPDDNVAELVESFGTQTTSLDTAKERITEATEQIAEAYSGRSMTMYADVEIHIHVTSPGCVTLTMIDVPGLVSTGISDADQAAIRNMSERFMQQSRTIILAVASASEDPANWAILELAKKHDPNQARTLGVISKADKVSSSETGELRSILCGKSDKYNLMRGYTLVKCRSEADVMGGVTLSASLDQESLFFATTEPWASLQSTMKSAFGTSRLKKRLANLQEAHIRKVLPDVRESFEAERRKLEAAVDALGTKIESVQEQMQCMQEIFDDIAGDFEAVQRGKFADARVVKPLILGKIAADETDDGAGSSDVLHLADDRLAALEMRFGWRLRAWLEAENATFKTKMAVAASVKSIDRDLMFCSGKDGEEDAAREAAAAAALRAELVERINYSRDDSLAGLFVPFEIFRSIFVERLVSWRCVVNEHAELVFAGIRNLLREVVKQTIAKHSILFDRFPALGGVVKGVVETVVTKYIDEAVHELEELFVQERSPHTLNDLLLHQFMEKSLAPFENAIENYRCDENGNLVIAEDALRLLVQNHWYLRDLSREDYEAITIHNGLDAYQGVASRTIVDTTAKIVIKNLLERLTRALQRPEADLISAAEWQQVFYESASTVMRRRQLEQRLERVRDCLTALNMPV
ncbi:dynamin [Thecamonas trahens ATCC 50062]|uniref:Dynamin n=1 Tax=Thecamonas trahens ATCC 50062 TaxID=461836 RepID=A0A0L0D569_THETB|nr:dynamin [Thecamonas trahens ATCC 50062]KNC47479.1 dynamin [Thecamonas trahens ATCC 50062]|eukprot:XP_013759415.1 dynamin [Thecamonas trahens ATCC 50062]